MNSRAASNNGTKSVIPTPTPSVSGSQSEKDRKEPLQTQVSSATAMSDISIIEEASVPPSRETDTSNQLAPSAASANTEEKNPIQLFNEYVATLFQRAEVYEQELEKRESIRDLRVSPSLDNVRHGSTRRNIIEEAGVARNNGEDEGDEPELSSPRLSPTTEAIAVVEAMSSFRSFTEVKREVSFRSETEQEPQTSKEKADEGTTDGIDEDAAVAVADEDDVWDKWDKFCETKRQNTYSEVALDDIHLTLTVDDFYNRVLCDNAPNSIGKFMTGNGDFDIKTTPWQPKDGHPTTRTIHYTHPVNVPMAPPSANAFKTQYLHKFGACGLCLESSTIVEDVPMTDCFVVDDRLWVCKDTENGGCVVNANFQIRFVKTTMFRRIIENATRSEFEKWWGLFGNMTRTLQGDSDVATDDEEDFEMVAKELEEITQMFEGDSQGNNAAPISDALKKIRSSSHRLSIVAKRTSTRRINETATKSEMGTAKVATSIYQFVISLIQSSISSLIDESQSKNIVAASFITLVFMGMFNLWTYLHFNKALLEVNSHLEQLILLSKMDQATTCSTR